MQFRHVEPALYYASIVIYFTITVLGGVFIKDLIIIFEFVSALVMTNLCFILPGYFYLKAKAKYGDKEEKGEGKWISFTVWSWILIGTGIIVFLIVATANILPLF
jgi:amino acid permease